MASVSCKLAQAPSDSNYIHIHFLVKPQSNAPVRSLTPSLLLDRGSPILYKIAFFVKSELRHLAGKAPNLLAS